MEFQNIVSPQSLGLIEMVEQYLQHHYALNNISKRTQANMRAFINSYKAFLNKIKKPNLSIAEVNHIFMDGLIVFLNTRGDSANCSRAVNVVVNTMEYCKSRQYISDNPIHDVKVRRGPAKDVICLEQNELQKLIYSQTEEKELEIVKDLYLFQCSTGVSYSDIWTIKIIKDNKGEWIYNRRAKNKNEYYVPLTRQARQILEKYNYKLPKVTNREYNVRIRKLTKSLNIDKHLTTHTARKTFATDMFDNKGMSVESIAYMMGHLNPNTTIKFYLRRSRNRLEMETREKLSAFM